VTGPGEFLTRVFVYLGWRDVHQPWMSDDVAVAFGFMVLLNVFVIGFLVCLWISIWRHPEALNDETR
jgi:hypothetical protein